MGEVREPEAAALVVGALTSDPEFLERIERELIERFGPVGVASPPWPFRFTDYYRAEMGPNLTRKFLAFERRPDPGELASIKRWTNDLESRVASPGSRPVNLDPGYVTLSKLVLASTKNYSHRVYLRDGIYAEITLSWVQGAFVPHPWTYPDYRTPFALDFFTQVRRTMVDR